MTADEARAVGKIAVSADDHCHVCGAKLIDLLGKEFPEHEGVFDAVYYTTHEMPYRSVLDGSE